MVYVASYPTDLVGIVRSAHENGLRTKLFGGTMVGLQYGALKTQLGSQLNNIIVHDFYVPEPTLQFPSIESFLKRYQAMAVSGGMDQLGFFRPAICLCEISRFSGKQYKRPVASITQSSANFSVRRLSIPSSAM